MTKLIFISTMNMFFSRAAKYGHLNILKYLISIEPTHGRFNIHINNNYIFTFTALNLHLKVLEYLITLESTHGEIYIQTEDDDDGDYETKKLRILDYVRSRYVDKK